MSGYKTSGYQGDIVSGKKNGPASDVAPLLADIILLSAEQGQPGPENREALARLVSKGREDQKKKNWSAADYNNLACAYFWHDREEGRRAAIEYFEKALALLAATPTSEEAKTIASNLNLVKALSSAG